MSISAFAAQAWRALRSVMARWGRPASGPDYSAMTNEQLLRIALGDDHAQR